MMASPILASENEVQAKRDTVAKEHVDEGGELEMHPLAAEEWLGSCILAALANPRATCELALINKNFYSASKSNLVWQKLLPPPPHLDCLFKECDDKTLQNSTFLSKKDLYFHLCKSISLGGGLKKFWLDQRTGGECYIISARALAIAWGSSSQYWEWLPCPGAWFPEVAFLRCVCWFDIAGRFRQLLKPGSYVVSFRMQMRSASTWRRNPIKLSLQNVTYAQPPVKSRAYFHRRFPVSNPPIATPHISNAVQPSANDPQHSESTDTNRHVWEECNLGKFTIEEKEDSLVEVEFSGWIRNLPTRPIWPKRSIYPRHSESTNMDRHVWVECDVGEFTVEENEDSPIEVEFSMREVEVLGWKTGFLLDGVLIRPSYVVNARDRPIVSMGSIYGYKGGDDQEMSAVEYADE